MSGRARAAGPGRGIARGGWHERAPRTAVAAAASMSLVALGVLAALLVPGLRSALAAEVADGSESFGVARSSTLLGAGAVSVASAAGSGGPGGAADVAAWVEPEAGWVVQPEPGGRGLLLHSPDGVLRVTLDPASDAEADAALDAAAGDRPVLHETLDSGLELRHVTVDGDLVGVLDAEGRPILVDAAIAQADGGGSDASEAEFPRYRRALADLLERVSAG